MSEAVRPPVHRDPGPSSNAPTPRTIDDAPSVRPGHIGKRTRYAKRFRVPEAARVGEADPTTIVVRELTVDEVETARKLGMGDRVKSMTEQTKLSLYEVDGHIVDHTRDEGTYLFNGWSQKVRELAILAYDKVSSNDAEDMNAFLSSMESA